MCEGGSNRPEHLGQEERVWRACHPSSLSPSFPFLKTRGQQGGASRGQLENTLKWRKGVSRNKFRKKSPRPGGVHLQGWPWEGRPHDLWNGRREKGPKRPGRAGWGEPPSAKHLLCDLEQVTKPLCGSVPASSNGNDNGAYGIKILEDSNKYIY